MHPGFGGAERQGKGERMWCEISLAEIEQTGMEGPAVADRAALSDGGLSTLRASADGGGSDFAAMVCLGISGDKRSAV